MKKCVRIFCALLALALLAAAAPGCGGSDTSAGSGAAKLSVPDDLEMVTKNNLYIDGASVYSHTAGKVAELFSEDYSDIRSSLDGSRLALYDRYEEDLRVVTERGQQYVSDADISFFALSLDGSTLVYLEKGESSRMSVVKYSLKTGESEQLAEIKNKKKDPVAVSPDGGCVLFADYGELCIYSDGEITETGEEGVPVAISDDAEYVYFMREEDGSQRLYVITDEEASLLGNASDSLYFNKTLSEVVFGSSTFFFSSNGSEGIKLKFYVPQVYREEACSDLNYSRYGFNAYALGRGSFIGTACKDDSTDSIIAITDDGTCKTWDAETDSVLFFNGGRSVLYCTVPKRPFDIYYIEDLSDPDAEPDIIAENVSIMTLYDSEFSWWVSPDGSHIYYICPDSTLNDMGHLHSLTTDGDDTEHNSGHLYHNDAVMDPYTGTMYYLDSSGSYQDHLFRLTSSGHSQRLEEVDSGMRFEVDEDAGWAYASGGKIRNLLLADGTLMPLES